MNGAIVHLLTCRDCELEASADSKPESERMAEEHLRREPTHRVLVTVAVEYRHH